MSIPSDDKTGKSSQEEETLESNQDADVEEATNDTDLTGLTGAVTQDSAQEDSGGLENADEEEKEEDQKKEVSEGPSDTVEPSKVGRARNRFRCYRFTPTSNFLRFLVIVSTFGIV